MYRLPTDTSTNAAFNKLCREARDGIDGASHIFVSTISPAISIDTADGATIHIVERRGTIQGRHGRNRWTWGHDTIADYLAERAGQ